MGSLFSWDLKIIVTKMLNKKISVIRLDNGKVGCYYMNAFKGGGNLCRDFYGEIDKRRDTELTIRFYKTGVRKSLMPGVKSGESFKMNF